MTRHLPAGVAAVVLMSGLLPRRPFLPLRHRQLSLRQLPSPVPAPQRQPPLLRPRTGVFQKNMPAIRFYSRRGFHLVELSDGSGNEEREPDAVYQWRR